MLLQRGKFAEAGRLGQHAGRVCYPERDADFTHFESRPKRKILAASPLSALRGARGLLIYRCA